MADVFLEDQLWRGVERFENTFIDAGNTILIIICQELNSYGADPILRSISD